MRSVRTMTAGVCAAVVGVVGLAGTAQAQTGAIPAATPSTVVAAGVETAIKVTLPTGCTGPVTVTGFPAPNGTNTNLQTINTGTTTKPFVRVSGVWPPPSPDPQTFALAVKCANSKTGTQNVVVEGAPAPTDVVGVGSDTTQNVYNQFSADYNASHKTSGTQLYSWDATNPFAPFGSPPDTIVTKETSSDHTTCSQPRPNGAGAGIMALENTKTISSSPCIDFARSTTGRASGDPTTITYVTLAGDAVTYATQPHTNAPPNLTAADLKAIYSCSATTWNQVGGTSTQTIAAMLPNSSSGIRKFFLAALGLPNTAASCVSTSDTLQGAAGNSANTLQQNEGVSPSLNTNPANVIFPFSVAKYLAEHFHSASCGTVTQCFANPTKCTPTAGQNLFGCNTHGTLLLNPITNTVGTVTNPTTPFPPTKSSTINTGFDPTFLLQIYEVVSSKTEGTIPPNLAPIFGPSGFTCTNAAAKLDLKNYGFAVLPAGSSPGDCGSTS